MCGMKREIELKFFVDDLGVVRKRLKKLGARIEWAGSEHDLLFDTPDKRLKKKQATLRLRQTPDFSYLTYKEKIPNQKFKMAYEYEVNNIQKPKELRKIFERLGFRVWFEYKKSRREFWRWKGYMITLDSFPFGKFVEIEGPEKFIHFAANKLGLDPARSSTKSYVKLLKEYKKPG